MKIFNTFSYQKLTIYDLYDFYLRLIIDFQRADNLKWPRITSTEIFELSRLYHFFDPVKRSLKINFSNWWSKKVTLGQISICSYGTRMILTLIREFLGKIKNAGPSPSASVEKKQSAALHHLYSMFLCSRFFRRSHSVKVSKMAYVFVQRGIFSLAYAFWN